MVMQAVVLTDDKDDRRSSERQAINQRSTLRDASLNACDVYVRDLSSTGCNVATDAQLTIGGTVFIGLPGHGRAEAHVVRRVSGGYGCEFVEPLTLSAMSQTFRGATVVRLTSADPIVEPLPEPDIALLPGAVRLGAIVGGSALLWAAIASVVAGLF